MIKGLQFEKFEELKIIVASRSGGHGHGSHESEDKVVFSDLHSIKSSVKFNSNLPTVLIIPGWRATFEDPRAQKIMKAYHTIGGHNVLIVDWSPYNFDSPSKVVRKVMGPIGVKVAEKLLHLMNKKVIDLKTWHIIGHSLGAHLGGWIGNVIKENSSGAVVIPRITGLDPSAAFIYNLFGKPLTKFRLTNNSGENSIKFIE